MNVIKETKNIGETFAELYQEYLDKIFRYVQYRVNEVQLAEDLTSAVFERALVNIEKYSSDKASFATWIFTIARNILIDYYRSRGRKQTVELDEATDKTIGDLSPEEKLLKKEENEKLKVCLVKLSDEEQEIIRLKFGGELNNRQIAEMTGLSESNVGTKLYRAVRKMRNDFQGLDDE